MPSPEAPYINLLAMPWWSGWVLWESGALGVLCFLIQWCQTLHLPQKHSIPLGPLDHCPLGEPSVSGVSPTTALTPTPHRTSLAEGEGVGEKIKTRRRGGCSGKVFKAFGGPGLGSRRKMCVSVCVNEECV